MRATACFLIAAALCAQTFEVASIKVNNSGDGRHSGPRLTNGKMTAQNASMRTILQAAWDLGSLQVNGPAWIDSDYFDIAATAPPGVPDTSLQPMLQALLKDRFKLESHIEMKEMPAYNLVVARDGPKIKPFDPNHPVRQPPRMPGAWGGFFGNVEMPQLAKALTGMAGRPVIDKTGLHGRYFCAVQYSQLGTDPQADGAPDIFGAVQQQLGLKLEPVRAQVEVLVVDRIDRNPTEN